MPVPAVRAWVGTWVGRTESTSATTYICSAGEVSFGLVGWDGYQAGKNAHVKRGRVRYGTNISCINLAYRIHHNTYIQHTYTSASTSPHTSTTRASRQPPAPTHHLPIPPSHLTTLITTPSPPLLLPQKCHPPSPPSPPSTQSTSCAPSPVPSPSTSVQPPPLPVGYVNTTVSQSVVRHGRLERAIGRGRCRCLWWGFRVRLGRCSLSELCFCFILFCRSSLKLLFLLCLDLPEQGVSRAPLSLFPGEELRMGGRMDGNGWQG